MKIDPAGSVEPLRRRLDAATGEREQVMLTVLERRVVAEIIGDAEAVGASVTPDFRLQTHPGGRSAAESREAFVAGFSAGLATVYRMLWVEWDHLAVDAVNETIAADGLMCLLLRGAAAARMHPGVADDASSDYLVRTPMAVCLTFRDGLVAREVTYTDTSAAVVTKLAETDIPGLDELAARLRE